MYRILLLCVLAWLLIFAGGCVRMIHPALEDSQLITDSALVGDWVDEDGQQIHIAQPAENIYSVRLTDSDGHTGVFDVRLGHVGELLLADIRPANPAAKQP